MRRLLGVLVGVATLTWVPIAAAETLDRFYAGNAKYIDSVTRGPDGRVWFTFLHGIGAVEPDGRVTLHRLPGIDPASLTAGPDGALWMTDSEKDLVVRRDMAGRLTTFRGLSSDASPGQITAGPDGNLWFIIERGLARITPGGQVAEYRSLPKDKNTWTVTAGPDGALWFLWDGGVGRMTTQGATRLWNAGDEGAFPESIALGPDGNLWAAGLYYDDLLRVTPSGVLTRIRAGPLVSEVTPGPDGNVWFADYYGVGRVAPTGASRIRWPEPFGGHTDCERFAGLGPDGGLAFDSSGALWAGSSSMRSLVRITSARPDRSPLEPFLRRAGSLRDPDAIARGVGGHVWVSAAGRIVRLDASGRQKVFRRRIGPEPGDLLPVRDGSVWFTVPRGLSRLFPSGRVRRYRRGFSRRSFVSVLARGPDGRIWFVDQGRRAIGRMTPAGRVRLFRRGLPRRGRLGTLATGRRHLWVAAGSGGVIRISTSGRVRRFVRGLSRKADPTAIARGPDGAMWFTEFGAHRIGRITTRGRVREFRVHESPAAITTGPDGALWFTTATTDDIDTTAGVGRITVSGRVDQFYAHQTCTGDTRGLISGPDGNLWFIEPHGPIAIGRLNPRRLVETGALALRR